MPSTCIPCLRYRDAPAAIRWLRDVFGFEPRLVVPDADGGIAHAQLVLPGGGMLMLGSTRDDDYGRVLAHPSETGGRETQTPYLVVGDVDAACARAIAAGARIVIEPRDEDHGGRGFACRDPEGRYWYAGTYDPWGPTPAEPPDATLA